MNWWFNIESIKLWLYLASPGSTSIIVPFDGLISCVELTMSHYNAASATAGFAIVTLADGSIALGSQTDNDLALVISAANTGTVFAETFVSPCNKKVSRGQTIKLASSAAQGTIVCSGTCTLVRPR